MISIVLIGDALRVSLRVAMRVAIGAYKLHTNKELWLEHVGGAAHFPPSFLLAGLMSRPDGSAPLPTANRRPANLEQRIIPA